MDSSEMRSLEEKTRAIVDTLSNLENETKRQKDMGDRLEQSRDAIEHLASDLRVVAEQLADVIGMINRSTLVEDVSRLDGIEANCSELLKNVGAIGEESSRRYEELSARLETLEVIIGRIDRNTQKGIGKERG